MLDEIKTFLKDKFSPSSRWLELKIGLLEIE